MLVEMDEIKMAGFGSWATSAQWVFPRREQLDATLALL
tara:strand:- start:2775 stop:2888 length:114 start_codon:yes stop_codon:yes gene_type:complete